MAAPYMLDFGVLGASHPALAPVAFAISELLGVQLLNAVWLIALVFALALLVSFDRVFLTISSGSTLKFQWRAFVQGLLVFFTQALLFRLAGLVFVGATWLVLAPQMAHALRTWIGLEFELHPNYPGLAFFWLAVLLAEDLARYLAHRLQHALPALWELHKFHHSAASLNILVSYREHPLIGLLNGAASLLAALLLAVPALMLSPGLLAAPPVYVGGMLAFVAYKCVFLMGHFHRPISYGFLDLCLVTSAVHALHHSDKATHFNKNFGGLVTLWDWLFATYLRPQADDLSALQFGLSESQDEMTRRLFPWDRLYLDMTWKAWRALKS